MTEFQQVVGIYIVIVVLRIPRVKERWIAPLMRGPEWFFDVAVAPDFLKGPGAALLRYYRWRLFIPWAIEGAILGALCLTGRSNAVNILLLITGIALSTRFNYYAARIATENKTRQFERPDAQQPASNVVLSLEPRTLPSYTKWWVEAGIALALGAAAVWLAYLPPSVAPSVRPRIINFLIVNVYIQAGLLLIKRGLIRSSGAAPADNVEQYLAWRESLRRFTTLTCDLTRFLITLQPLMVLAFVTGGSARLIALPVFFAVSLAGFGVGLWIRLAHLKVARRTKPAKFPLLPAAQQARGVVGFWPSLPILLLRTANGYALNLASSPVQIAGLYFAGFAGLLVWLAR
jgi:hypothetical protein